MVMLKPGPRPLKRILLTISPELLEVLDAARGKAAERNAYIEDLLWKTTKIKQVAKDMKAARYPRRRDGRLPYKQPD